MILAFKEQFADKILWGIKKHTIREDKKGRWKPGMKIHFATDVRTKKQRQFGESICTAVMLIRINPTTKRIMIQIDQNTGYIKSTEEEISNFAIDDGFDSAEEFWRWFDTPFEGKLIFWEELKEVRGA